MKFVDEATIEAVGGQGGRGIVSFRRESHVPQGGPDGGDGGKGGDVIAEADARTATLLDHRYHRWYRADGGQSGGPKKATGRSADDLIVPVPPGTILTDESTGEVLADLQEVGDRAVLAKGGRGGKGNAHFKTSLRRVPRFAQDGEEGEHRVVSLSLKLVADVGLLGLPNAGKSTFIRQVTASRARVADYPFTTLVPNLGVVRFGERTFVLADIPGLVEGASEGLGLGHRFLKHVERTRVLVHLLSLGPHAEDPMVAFETVNAELRKHDPVLAERPQIVVLNKVDLVDDRYEIDLWREAFGARGVEVLAASGLTGESVQPVLARVLEVLDADAEPSDEPEAWSPI